MLPFCRSWERVSQTAIAKIFAGTFESIKATPEDLTPSISAADGIWIGDLIVAKHYRIMSAGDAVSKSLLFQLRTLIRPYFGSKLIFARTEREDVRRLLINQGFVPFLREGQELTGLTPFVRLTDDRKHVAFASRKSPETARAVTASNG